MLQQWPAPNFRSRVTNEQSKDNNLCGHLDAKPAIVWVSGPACSINKCLATQSLWIFREHCLIQGTFMEEDVWKSPGSYAKIRTIILKVLIQEHFYLGSIERKSANSHFRLRVISPFTYFFAYFPNLWNITSDCNRFLMI